MIGIIILGAVIVACLLGGAIHAGFQADWTDSLIIAALLVLLALDGWLLWHFQFQPALPTN